MQLMSIQQRAKGQIQRWLLAGLVVSVALWSSAARAERIYVVTADQTLASFDSGTPAAWLSNVPVSGLGPGEYLVSIDYRPSDKQIYGLGSSSTVYTVNRSTGAATAVGPSFTPALSGFNFGLDFNPVVDQLRVASSSHQNLRINPNTGQVAAVNGDHHYNVGDANELNWPYISHVAYNNNVVGAATTTLFGIDVLQDVLVTIDPPSGGLTTVGALGLDVSEFGGFDISGKSGAAYAVLRQPAGFSNLYTIHLGTGALTLVGPVGNGQQFIKGMTVVPEPTTWALAAIGLVALGWFSRRRS